MGRGGALRDLLQVQCPFAATPYNGFMSHNRVTCYDYVSQDSLTLSKGLSNSLSNSLHFVAPSVSAAVSVVAIGITELFIQRAPLLVPPVPQVFCVARARLVRAPSETMGKFIGRVPGQCPPYAKRGHAPSVPRRHTSVAPRSSLHAGSACDGPMPQTSCFTGVT